MTTEYALINSVLTEEFEGELIIHNVENGRTLLLNSSAAAIAGLLAETSTADGLATQLAQLYGVSKEHLKEDIATTLDQLHREGMVLLNKV